MEDSIECPMCGSESAYFNSLCYECPSCDYIWDCIDEDKDDNDLDEDDKDNDTAITRTGEGRENI
jgi:uncharacterized Zn ribbon protein